MVSEDDKKAVLDIIDEMNQCWIERRPQDLEKYFHDKIKIVNHHMKVLGDGKGACIQSYVDFLNKAEVLEITAKAPEVYLYGQTAVSYYNFHIVWKVGDETFHEDGHECYVLTREKDRWLVVMRKLLKKD